MLFKKKRYASNNENKILARCQTRAIFCSVVIIVAVFSIAAATSAFFKLNSFLSLLSFGFLNILFSVCFSRTVIEFSFGPGLEALRALREFTEEFCHELAMPLSFMKTEVQLISARHRTAPRTEIDIFKDGVERMNALLEDIKVLTALESYGRHPELSIISLDQIITDSLTSFANDLQLANIIVDGSDIQPVSVIADKDGLIRVVSNLLKNTLLYVPEGCILKVSLRRDGDYAIMSFCDNGEGLSASDLSMIFDRFFRSKNVRSSDKGSGLGLSIVKSVIDSHGGTVVATSSPGSGIKFTIRLPRYPSTHPLAFFLLTTK